MALKHVVFKGLVGERELPSQRKNVFSEGTKSFVAKTQGTDAEKTVKAALKKLGGIKKVVKPGDKVLLKPNLVFGYPNPCTTAPDFLTAVIELCQNAGAEVTVGERSAYWIKTRTIAEKLGIDTLCEKSDAKLLLFDEHKWHRCRLGLSKVKQVVLPEALWNHDKLIWLPTMKTHRLARFSMSLKLSIGAIHPMEMPTLMFLGALETKIAEINKAMRPDLVLMDGRKSFITEGPDTGDVVKPGIVLASGDRVANDAVGVQLLKGYKARNKLLWDDPYEYEQIKRAAELGVGAKSIKNIIVL